MNNRQNRVGFIASSNFQSSFLLVLWMVVLDLVVVGCGLLLGLSHGALSIPGIPFIIDLSVLGLVVEGNTISISFRS